MMGSEAKTKAKPKPAPAKKASGKKKVNQPCIPCSAKGDVATDSAKKIDNCPEAKKIWEKAKQANGGKNPKIVSGSTSTGGQMLDGTVTLESTEKDKCVSARTAIFELINLSRQKAFDDLDTLAWTGKISEEDYAYQSEKIEYENALENLRVLEACKKTWKCGGAADSDLAFVKKSKNFDDYFKNKLKQTHIDATKKRWQFMQSDKNATPYKPPKK